MPKIGVFLPVRSVSMPTYGGKRDSTMRVQMHIAPKKVCVAWGITIFYVFVREFLKCL